MRDARCPPAFRGLWFVACVLGAEKCGIMMVFASGGFLGFNRQPSCRGANCTPHFLSQETPLDPPKMGRNRPRGPPGGLWSPSQGLFSRVGVPKCANFKSWRFAQAKLLFLLLPGGQDGPKMPEKVSWRPPRGLLGASWRRFFLGLKKGCKHNGQGTATGGPAHPRHHHFGTTGRDIGRGKPLLGKGN